MFSQGFRPEGSGVFALLDRFGLVQRRDSVRPELYRDMLICKEDYRFSPLDTMFIDELTAVKRETVGG